MEHVWEKLSRGKTVMSYISPSQFEDVGHMILYNESDRCEICKKKKLLYLYKVQLWTASKVVV